MNEITTTPAPVSAATLEHVLGTGDLSKLTVPQRVEYYSRVCQTLGLNPLTRPFRFLSFNGQILLYATKDCTDQLRSLHKISLTIVDKSIDGDVYIVTARAAQPDGRTDEDIGAVTVGRLTGDSKANAVMKAMTKAKRRVTLSIRGLGFLDESELDTLPGARVFDPEEPVPETSAPVVTTPPPPAAPNPTTETKPPTATKPPRFESWFEELKMDLAQAQSRLGVEAISGRTKVQDVLGAANAGSVQAERASRVLDLFADAYERMARLTPAEEEEANSV
jgi:hypothetical protein